MKSADKYLDSHDVLGGGKKPVKVNLTPFVNSVFKNATNLDAYLSSSIQSQQKKRSRKINSLSILNGDSSPKKGEKQTHRSDEGSIYGKL